MLKELYSEFVCPKDQYANGFDVSLQINAGGFAKTKKVKKTMDEA